MIKVAFHIQKGGTGKTTLAGNVSYALSKNKKTILIDCDPQGNASSWFLVENPPYELADVLKAGLFGVIERGKAQVGDKTMVDALTPAVEAFEQAAEDSVGIAEALGQTVAAAERGMKDTIPLIARKGRASYLGERSIGHQDPGATSVYLILKALHDVVS